MHIPRTIRLAGRSISSNSPTILSGLAIAGVVATAVLAAKAAPKASNKIEEAEEAKNQEVWRVSTANNVDPADLQSLTPVEIVKATWTIYLPAAVTGVATIACIIGSNAIGMRRNIALAGAYALVDGAFRNYKDEVLAIVGEKKEQTIQDNVLIKEMERNPPPKDDSQVIIVGGGDVLCYESLSGRYFRSDAESIRRAENDFNRELLNHSMYSDLNLWFDCLGLEHTDMGAVLGWSVERTLDTFFTSHLTGEGKPCLAIGYKTRPFEDFGKL